MRKKQNINSQRLKKPFKISIAKFFIVRVLTIFILVMLFLGFNYYNNLIIRKELHNILLPTKAKGVPVRLQIPKIKVDAIVEQVGITDQKAMDVPSSSAHAGWFKFGPKPGEKGSAVIDGHVDSENGGEGVFGNLRELIQGDKIIVENDEGKSFSFIVQQTRIFDEGSQVQDVFNLNDEVRLNLITCDGVWDGTKNTYTQRLVVFATAAK